MTWVRPAAAAGLLLASTAAMAPAQEGAPGLLRDIAQPPQAYAPLLFPPGGHLFVPLGGALYTIGWEGAEGHELWRSDGTREGTGPVVDICSGACTGAFPLELVTSGGVLYFVGNDGRHGFELWRSDGTADGTWMVKDVDPLADSRPEFLLPAPGGLYFVAGHPTFGRELWWSDGTTVGTQLVADLLPGNPSYQEGPSHLVMLNGTLLFAADDGVHGRELYRSDGTAAGTARIFDIRPGAPGALDWYQPFPNSFYSPVVANGRVFFTARNPAGTQLSTWATDGTAAGTVQLHAGASPGTPHLFVFDDVVLFNGPGRTPWRSDGTPEGTYTLGTGGIPQPGPFARLADRVYFPGTGAEGRELWTTDGTVEGTHLVKDVQPGPGHGLDWTYYTLHATSGRLFFSANDGVHGHELWSSDGTGPGTTMVADLLPGASSSFSLFQVTIPNHLGQHLLFETAAEGGFALRSLDLGSGEVLSLHGTGDRPGSNAFCGLDWVCDLIDATPNGVGFLAFDLASSGEPWTSDGNPAGTRRAADLYPGPEPSMPWAALHGAFAQVEERLLVLARDGADQGRLFAISPTGVTPLEITSEPGSASEVAVWKGAAFVATQAGLFRTDGTPGGSTQLAGGDCTWGELVSGIEDLFFLNFGRLWATDGTLEGTRRIAPTIDLTVTLLADASSSGDQRLYFAGSETTSGRELWVTDGTDDGTRRVVDLRPGSQSAIPDQPDDPSGFFDRNRILVASGGRAFFVADDGLGGQELWVSDGSPGDASVLYAWPGAGSASPRWLAAVGDRVYFVADDGVHGREPWVTQGTQGTTRLLADLRPGPGSSAARELAAWGDRLVLAADDGVHGMELWRTGATDLDADPPVMHEIRPGPRPSSPMGFTVSSGRLFFFADDGIHGLEPWAWPIGLRFFEDGFESGDLREWTPSPP